jgi:hypothetical protein
MSKKLEVLSKIRARKAKLSDELKSIEEKEDAMEESIMADMLNSGIQSINLAGVGTVFLSKSEYPSVEDVQNFFGYLRKNGQADLIKETVHPQTLRGWWNGLENKPDPSTIGLGVYSKTKLSIRKN